MGKLLVLIILIGIIWGARVFVIADTETKAMDDATNKMERFCDSYEKIEARNRQYMSDEQAAAQVDRMSKLCGEE